MGINFWIWVISQKFISNDNIKTSNLHYDIIFVPLQNKPCNNLLTTILMKLKFLVPS